MNSGPTPPPTPPQPPHRPDGSGTGPGASDPRSSGSTSPHQDAPSGPTYSASPLGSGPAGGSAPNNGPTAPGPATTPNPTTPAGPAGSGGSGGSTTPGFAGSYAASRPGPVGSGPAGTTASGTGPLGGSVPQPAPAPGYVPGPDHPQEKRTRGDKKKSKLPLLLSLGAVALVLILVIVGFFVVRSVNSTKYGPDKLAEDYLSALEAGKMDQANEITEATAPDGASTKLLVQKIVDGSKDKITDTKIVETTRDGDTAKIHAKYALGGQPYDLVLTAKKDGRQGLFFDKWRLEPPVLPTIALEVPPISGTTINGTEFTPESGRVEYAVWPGRYEVQVPESTFIAKAEGNTSVGFADEADPQASTLKLAVEPTPAFDSEVKKLVEAKVNECAKVKKTTVDGCPMVNINWQDEKKKPAADAVDESTIERKIEKMPEIRTALSPDGSGGSFYTVDGKKGKMKVTASGKGAKKNAKWEGDVELNARGSVKLDGDKLSVTFF